MASDRAEQTAHDVIKNLRKPTITKGKILKQNGYADSVAKHPDIVTKTKSYQKVARPYLKRLEGLRDKIITEMEVKDISKNDLENYQQHCKEQITIFNLYQEAQQNEVK